MRIQIVKIGVLLSCCEGSLAFSAHRYKEPSVRTSTSLTGQKNGWIAPAVSAVVGWGLASQLALANMMPSTLYEDQHQAIFASSSSLVAVESLDFSLPSYDSIGKSTGGFGQGSEARIGLTDSLTVPGANERAKQEDAMKRAEEARQARKQAEKKAREQRSEEARIQAELKKKEEQRRIKELFGG